ncbi:ABC transporter ATP-binding protein [Peredibacter starrii]|uniref:ABC transporter ATP-binding protein n=1 Tax=Peredibacter starrii TaxID=28202 RepID=A0AAX4HN44_9BACT|nr:ABC transporter ATP-binding protein [Peredibacter starrii]WPU64646.1 ABC transporter ATP-binding protein [Peredibacter starrii]
MSRKLQFHLKTDDRIKSGERFRDQLKLMAKPETGFIKAIVVNTLAVSLLSLGVPLAIQVIINNIGVRTMTQPLVVLCLLLLFILSCSGTLQAIQTYTVEILQRRLFVRYGLIISERLTWYQDKYFKEANSPDLINRYFDIIIMQSSMVTFFVSGFGFIIQFLIGFSLLAFYHPYFLGFAGFMTQFLFINWMLFGPDGVKAGSPEADGKYEVVSWVEELSRVRNIFSSDNGKDFSSSKMTHLFNRWLEVRNNLFNFQFRQHIGLQIFGVVMNVLLLGMGGFLVLNGELSAGQLVAAALVVNSIIASLPNLQNFFFSVYNYSTALDMTARFYDYPLEKVKEDVQSPKSYDFSFENLKFEPNYEFNFSYKEGTKNLILVKSFSSIQLFYEALMGFSEHSEGKIKFDNLLVDDVDIGEVRNHIMIVRHDQFFAGTVKENLIGLGNKKFTATEIDDVLARVGLTENIAKLPLGIDTPIRPNGFPFSKSQLLAIQFARALLLKPKILLVTPDFEQISTFKRKLVYKELVDRKHDWTLLFFTQRFYKGDFDRYTVFERSSMRDIKGESELLKEIENYG